MTIPEDLRKFLSDPINRHLRFNDGEVTDIILFAPEEIPKRVFDIDRSGHELSGQGGHVKLRSEHCGLDLVKKCNNYQPEGILAWFPELQMYGSWDCDHHTIMVYPGSTWTDISRDPGPFFNGQWYPQNVQHRYL